MHRLNIAIGNFFFRYRNALFPLVLAIGALTLQPTVMFGNFVADRILQVVGAIVALLGEGVRLTTIGFQYIHRGGKDGQVYAGRLVQGGVYGITRNPMYVSNALIAIGTIMLFGSPWGYLILIPFFLLVYQSIVAAEENYLRSKFGDGYRDYERAVNRYLPTLSRVAKSFSGMSFDWRRAIRQEMGTVVGLTIGFILISVWRSYYLHGFEPAKVAAIRAIWLILGITAAYLFLIRLKKSKKLFKESANLQN
jgi:protein-S-isoprenylcysteine O-methyltransferase Ste14